MGDLAIAVLPDVTSDDLERLPKERLEAELCTRAAQSASAMCRWLVMVAEFDRREAAMEWYGIVSTAHWLAWRCAMDARTARDHVRVARAIVGLPKTLAAFAAGELSYSKVRALTRVARFDTEDRWLDTARNATTAQLEDTVPSATRSIRPVRTRSARTSPEIAGCATARRDAPRSSSTFPQTKQQRCSPSSTAGGTRSSPRKRVVQLNRTCACPTASDEHVHSWR